jgi:hypothetical protein
MAAAVAIGGGRRQTLPCLSIANRAAARMQSPACRARRNYLQIRLFVCTHGSSFCHGARMRFGGLRTSESRRQFGFGARRRRPRRLRILESSATKESACAYLLERLSRQNEALTSYVDRMRSPPFLASVDGSAVFIGSAGKRWWKPTQRPCVTIGVFARAAFRNPKRLSAATSASSPPAKCTVAAICRSTATRP